MNNKVRIAALCSSAITLGLSVPAVAQTAPAPIAAAGDAAASAQDDDRLGEIVVTATKREESINRVPLSITSASGEQLRSLGITDTAALIKAVPGFNAVDSSYGSPVYYLRGIGYFDTTLLAKPTVGVYIDEMPVPFNVMAAGAVFDLERVEVLKGPQGTLFGANATGGAINYIAAKPKDQLEIGLSGQFGRFAQADGTFYITGPLSDTISTRMAVRHEMRGDWQRSITRNETIGQRDFTQARWQLLFEPSNRFKANLTLSGFLDKSETQQPQFVTYFQQTVTSVLDPRLLVYPNATSNSRQADWGSTFPLRKDNKMAQASLRMDYSITDNTVLTSLSTYGYYKQAQGLDADGTSLRLSDLFITGKINTFVQELRLAGGQPSGLTWLVGGNYEHSQGPENVRQRLDDQTSAKAFTRFGFAVLDFNAQRSYTEYESYAAFGNADYALGSLFKLHGGLRYTKTKTDFSGCSVNDGNGAFGLGIAFITGLPASTVPVGSCATIVRRNGVASFGPAIGSLPEDNISWRAGVDFTPAPNQLFYASVSRGYKAGGFSNLPGSDESQYKPVVQEKLTAYEVGFKSTLIPRALQATGALFYYDYTNKQVKGRTNVPIFNFLEALVNLPKSRIKGAEAQIIASPWSGMRANVGATYLDSRVTASFQNFNAFGIPTNFQNARFSNTPKWQVNADVEQTLPVSTNVEAFGGGSLTYRSATNGDFGTDPRLAINAYTLIDLRLGVRSTNDNWRVGLFGRNVTDKYYWTTATRRGDAVVRYAGMPATYGVDFSVKF